MNDWKKTNYAQWGTYRALVSNGQIDPVLVSFAEAEAFKMPGLSFFVLGASKEDLSTRAELVAMEFFNFIVLNYAPDWESKDEVDSTREALNAFIDVLTDKDKSVADLSAVVDFVFKFSNE